MTQDQVRNVLLKYRARLTEGEGATPKRCPNLFARDTPSTDTFDHLVWMIDEMLTFGPERWDKTMRWLGFIQGALWVAGIYSVEEMKEDNVA